MMAHPTKKQRPNGGGDDVSLAEEAKTADQMMATAPSVGTDVLANIFGYLDGPKDIMQKRRVCKKWKEAVRETIVPLVKFCVNSPETYNGMSIMTAALPNLQQIEIGCLRRPFERHKYNDGEDPDEEQATLTRGAAYTTHDIEIISNFRKLRILDIKIAQLNGKYPVLFNFPLLEKLSIKNCFCLKVDLEMLTGGLPMLRELTCNGIAEEPGMSSRSTAAGNINSLRVLKETLEKLDLGDCKNVVGNFMDLADFPHLKELDLFGTAVTGDIRDIGQNDFSTLEQLFLPKGVYGGTGYEMHRTSDARELIKTVYLFKKQRPSLLKINCWHGRLSDDSPDNPYSELIIEMRRDQEALGFEDDEPSPSVRIQLVEAGPRIGCQWLSGCLVSGDFDIGRVLWIDPEPDRESSDYETYIEELREIEGAEEAYPTNGNIF